MPIETPPGGRKRRPSMFNLTSSKSKDSSHNSEGDSHQSPQSHHVSSLPMDLSEIFDHFDRPKFQNTGSDEEGGENDMSHLSPEARTKLLLEQRGEKLAEVEDRAKKLADASQAYRDNTAQIKEEAIKQSKKWF